MTILQNGVLFLAILGVATAMRCYAGTTAAGSSPPTTVTCDQSISFCKKTTSLDGSTFTYHCDVEGHCTKGGCFTASDGRNMCCCQGSLCNSSQGFSKVFALISVALMKVLVF
ncbi:hypothetical protein Q1695_011911 [Nippostrongylus brasiliensis]|nr:hypothetical protein Q1695_011911 [Nippostrongylus brasiliensis]